MRGSKNGPKVNCYKVLKSKKSDNVVMISTEKYVKRKKKNETNNERDGLLGFSLPVLEYIW